MKVKILIRLNFVFENVVKNGKFHFSRTGIEPRATVNRVFHAFC